MGQFSSSARIDFPLSEKVDPRLSNLTSWTCQKTWVVGMPGMPADRCQGDADEQQCIDDAHCIVRRKGFTEMGSALCGGPRPNDGRTTLETCRGGAAGELWTATDIDIVDPDEGNNCSDHSGNSPLQAVLLITDGKPRTPNPAGNPVEQGILGTRDAVTAAKLIKSMSDTKIFGVMVGSQLTDAYETLKALSSCCGADQTKVKEEIPTSAQCTHTVNEDCPYSFFVDNWEGLLQSVETIFQELTLFTYHDCTVTTTTTRTVPITSAFWLLLLPLPVLLSLLWGWTLLLCSRCCGYTLPEARETPVQGPGDVGPISSPQPFEVDRTGSQLLLQSFGDAPVATIRSMGPDTLIDDAEYGSPSAAGYKGRKWAPVRHSYMINGRPMDVDYGQSTAAPPPMAPTRARRGSEQASLQDTPETALQHMKFKAVVGTIRAAIAFRKAANLPEFAPLEVENVEAADTEDAAQAPEEPPTDSTVQRLISDIIIEPDELPRSLRALHCTMFFMLCVTLAMVPAVWYLSFPSFRPWEAIPWDSLENKFEELLGNPHKEG